MSFFRRGIMTQVGGLVLGLIGIQSVVLAEIEQSAWPPFNVEQLVGLRVDVDWNCFSSSSPTTTHATRVVGEDLSDSCPWTYKIKLKVKGRLPTDGGVTWGGAVMVNGVQVEASEGGLGLTCNMEDFEEELVIFLAPGETVSVGYWHNQIDIDDGYAEITSASVIKGMIVEDCNGSSCNAHPNPFNESMGVDLRFGMAGPNSKNFGKLGCLRLYHPEPTPLAFQPTGLCYMNLEDGAEVILDNVNKGCLRQVKGSDGLMEIIPIPGTYSYDIKLYRPEDVGAKSGDYYTVTGAAYETITVRNPNSLPYIIDKVEVLSSTGTTEFQWISADSGWTLIHADDETRERRYASTSGNVRTEVLEVMDHVTQVVDYREEEKFLLASWGEPLLSRTLNPGASNEKTTEFTYWTNSLDNGFKQVRQITFPGGKWESYEYDTGGRVIRKMESLLDYGMTTNTSLCRMIDYDYAALVGSGDNLSHTNTPRMTIEYEAGKEVARSYRVIKDHEEQVIQCQTPGAAWTALDNLATITKRYSSGSFSNFVASVEFPNGTMELREYNNFSSRYDTIYRGEPNAAKDTIIAGTKWYAGYDVHGRKTIELWNDVDYTLGQSTHWFYNFDERGRPGRTVYQDSSFSEIIYGCCGPTQTTDRDGTVTQFTYDELGNKTGQTSPGAGTSANSWTYYSYNARGQLLTETVTGSSNPLRAMGYALDGSLTSETNAMGGVTTYLESLDPGNGRYTKTTTNPDGGTTIERYFLDGRIERITGTAVAPKRYEYAVEQVGPNWCRTTKVIDLDSSGNDTLQWVKTFSDALGRTFRTEYAAATSPYPYEETMYNDLGQRIKHRDADGVVTLFSYDGQGQLEYQGIDVDQDDVLDLSGPDRVTRTLATSNGRYNNVTETFVLETDGVATETLVSKQVQTVSSQTQTLYQDGVTGESTTTVTVNDGPNRTRTVTTTFPDSHKEEQTYLDNLLRTTRSLDSSGQVIHQIDYSYDGQGRLVEQVDSIGGRTSYTYNEAELVASITTGITQQTTSTLYNGSLQAVEMTEPDGNVNYREYYPHGQLKKTYGIRTLPVEYTYDDQNRVRTQKTWQDYAGNSETAITRWNYDSYRGWLVSKDYPDEVTGDAPTTEGTGGPVFSYSDAGRLATRTWQRGIIRTNSYNNAGELGSITYSDATPGEVYTYTRRGQIKTVTRDGLKTTHSYNGAGQAEIESYSGGLLGGLAIDRIYDSQGRRTQLQLQAGATVMSDVDYDWSSVSPTRGLLNGITHGGKTLVYTYRSDNLISGISEGTVFQHTKYYDDLKRVTQIETQISSTPIPMGYTLQYNQANQRVRIEREDGSYWGYSYDSLGQLTAGDRYWSDGSAVDGQAFSYAYDDIGNRINTDGRASSVSGYTPNRRNEYSDRSVAAVVDVQGLANPTANVTVNGFVADRKKEYFHKALGVNNSSGPVYSNLTIASTYGGGQSATGKVYVPQTPETFNYDHDGNLLDDGRWEYTWDAENRLIEMKTIGTVPLTPSGATKRLEFTYDYLGRRIGKKVYDQASGGTLLEDIKFVYDGWHLVAELDAFDNLIRSYVWGIDLSGSIGGAGGVGGLLKITEHGQGGSSHYPAYDANGNVVGLVDASSGAWSAQYEYGPFGELIRATGVMAASNPFRFSTKYTDDESGLLYYGMRYYNPTTGRWISRDPIGEQGGLNLYGFVGNSPNNFVDPFGEQAAPFGPTDPRFLPGATRIGAPKGTPANRAANRQFGNIFRDHFLGGANALQNEWDFDGGSPWTTAFRSEYKSHFDDVRVNIRSDILDFCCSGKNREAIGNPKAAHYSLNDKSPAENTQIFLSDMLRYIGVSSELKRLGSFRSFYTIGEVDCNTKCAKVKFQAHDAFRFGSMLRLPMTDIGPPDNPFGSYRQPFNTVNVNWYWEEKVCVRQ